MRQKLDNLAIQFAPAPAASCRVSSSSAATHGGAGIAPAPAVRFHGRRQSTQGANSMPKRAPGVSRDGAAEIRDKAAARPLTRQY